MTDVSEDSDVDVKKNIENIFNSSSISTIETNDDCLIIRPSELSSILISKKSTLDSEQIDKKEPGKEVLKLTDENVKK